MIKVLIFAETIDELSFEILSHVSQYHLEILSSGNVEKAHIKKLKKHGVRRVNLIQTLLSEIKDPEIYARILSDFIKTENYDYIFTGSATIVKDVFPRLSALFNSALATGVIGFELTEESLIATKTIYASECLVDVEMIGPIPRFILVESRALVGSEKISHSEMDNCDEIEIVPIKIKGYEAQIKLDHIIAGTSKYPCLNDAEIIVSAGRGFKESQDMKLLEALAEQLGASIGVSLGAVESDVAPRELLIGQSASCVSPSLYIACGISGAKQHMTGLKNCQRIMAINSDQNAPIMRVADYALVGDLYKILPRITALLSKKMKQKQ